jgi:hypothetical protein
VGFVVAAGSDAGVVGFVTDAGVVVVAVAGAAAAGGAERSQDVSDVGDLERLLDERS